MSRIGRKAIEVPPGTKVAVRDGALVAEGPKGKLSQTLATGISAEVTEDQVTLARNDDSGPSRSMHGLMRALVSNAIVGVSGGFSKKLEIVGVGYRAEVQGTNVNFSLGYSHPVVFPIPKGIEIEIDKQNRITVSGCDRHQVGQVAAEIRGLRRPDPYKGKGIRYAGEAIRRKAGKAGS